MSKTLLVAIVLLFGLSGCHRQPEPPPRFAPGEPMYERFTTQGSRAMISFPEEDRAFKVRRRRSHLRVYDEKMRYVGQVKHPSVSEEIQVRSPGGALLYSTKRINDHTVELEHRWRLERVHPSGWDLFDSQGELRGLFRRDEDSHWYFQDRYQSRDRIRVKGTSLFVELNYAESARTRVKIGHRLLAIEKAVASPAPLAFAAQGLTPLEQVVLFQWLFHKEPTFSEKIFARPPLLDPALADDPSEGRSPGIRDRFFREILELQPLVEELKESGIFD